jgi:hypothetical protein
VNRPRVRSLYRGVDGLARPGQLPGRVASPAGCRLTTPVCALRSDSMRTCVPSWARERERGERGGSGGCRLLAASHVIAVTGCQAWKASALGAWRFFYSEVNL